MITDEKYNPPLSLIYLPHLDYSLQKYGPDLTKISQELKAIDQVVASLVNYYEARNARIIILSEYGIGPVTHPIHINRILREQDLLAIIQVRKIDQ